MKNTDDALKRFKDDVELYLNATMDARGLCERDRDYLDGKQWTADEIAVLRGRGQAPIVVNRVKPKHQGLIGLLDIRRSEPKAYPRTKKHEKSSEAMTDALRFVSDNNDFNTKTRLECADNFFCEGTAAAIIDVETKRGEPEITIKTIPWDRFYYDPFSRRLDFTDARFMGLIVWLDFDQFGVNFPNADISELESMARTESDTETFEDRPRWIDIKKKRVRVAQHFYLDKEVWHECYFTDSKILIESKPSPYLDEDGEPACPIEAVSANIDRDNNRYGEVRQFIDQQDEINHRRSKALHLLSQRQTFGRKGSEKDLSKLKRELAKPNGHIEFTGEQFGKDFGILPTSDMLQGQFELYQDAKAELDSVSFNAQLAGERQSGDLSGKAIDRLQQAGTIELNRQYTMFSSFEKRIYRQIWSRIKQHWTAEKWIRVTDDQDNLRWVGLNGEIKLQDWMEEIIQDKSEPLTKRKKVSASFQMLMAAMDGEDLNQAEQAEQILNQIIGVSNPVAELDVDIVLDQSYDSVNIQQEQFQTLAQFAQGSDIDIIELIELSQLRGKDELIEKIETRRQEQAQAAGGAQQMQAQAEQAKVAKMAADTQLQAQKAIQTQAQTFMLVNNPDPDPQVIT